MRGTRMVRLLREHSPEDLRGLLLVSVSLIGWQRSRIEGEGVEHPCLPVIGIALVVYVFSALTLTLARITQGTGNYRGWSHLFYITAFYIFYAFAGAIEDTFWAVFTAGLIILGLENYAIRTYCIETIQDEMELLERINESEKPKAQSPKKDL